MGYKPLDPAKLALIHQYIDMGYSVSDIVSLVSCSRALVTKVRQNAMIHGSPHTPEEFRGKRGPQPLVIEEMWQHVWDYLILHPTAYQDELALVLWQDYNVVVSQPHISRVLKARGWTRKKARKVPQERNQELRTAWPAEIAEYNAHQAVCVDECGCDERSGVRRFGYAPKG